MPVVGNTELRSQGDLVYRQYCLLPAINLKNIYFISISRVLRGSTIINYSIGYFFNGDVWNNSLDFRRFLESGVRSSLRKLSSEEERGFLSRTAPDNRA